MLAGEDKRENLPAKRVAVWANASLIKVGTHRNFRNSEITAHAENAVKFLGHVCNKYHPLVLLQEMTLAELYLANGNLSKGRKMIQQLIEKCEISFGKEYEYISSYRKMLADIWIEYLIYDYEMAAKYNLT